MPWRLLTAAWRARHLQPIENHGLRARERFDAEVGGGGTGPQTAPSDPSGQTSGRIPHSPPAESAADLSLRAAYPALAYLDEQIKRGRIE